MRVATDRALHARVRGSARVEPLALALVAVVAFATLALIGAERAGSQRGIWVAKPVASAAFVALGLHRDAPSPYDTFHAALVAALLLSFVGDLLLIPRATRAFRASIVAFLLAHLAFVVAFGPGGAWSLDGVLVAALSLVPLVGAAIVVSLWILPKAPRALKPAVVAYVVVITVMVAVAAGTRSPWIVAAALAFWGNDILVARDRFVERSWLNRAFGLPLYYGAMVVFALLASGALAR